MNDVLIIGDHLLMAGAERLIYELTYFAKANNSKVTVLITNNYNKEYYDDILKALDVNVVRTSLFNTNKLRNPLSILRSLFWRMKLKYFAHQYYKSIHIIGLYNVKKAVHVKHPHRFLWHVNNAVQYFGGKYDFAEGIFEDKMDTVICINQYQMDELAIQYGGAIKCKTILFKLFLADI
jgi:hypothetical protein